MEQSEGAPRTRIWELVRYYLRLGALGFGGPVALCGQMEKELVTERQWLTKDEFRDGLAVCQSLPGPLAIEAIKLVGITQPEQHLPLENLDTSGGRCQLTHCSAS